MNSELSPNTVTRTALACFIASLTGVVPLFVGTFSLFLIPISEEFGWGRTRLSIIFGATGLCGAMLSPLLGVLIDRIGARTAMAAGMLIFGAGLLSLGFMPNSVPLVFLGFLAVAFGGGLGGPLVCFKVLATIPPSKRGLVMGLVLGIGVGLGMLWSVPTTTRLLTLYGWRRTEMIFALIVICLATPLAIGLLPRGVSGKLDTEASKREAPEARRSMAFWTIVGASFLLMVPTAGFQAHAVAIFVGQGSSAAAAAGALVAMALAAMIAQPVVGAILDRSKSVRSILWFPVAGFVGLNLCAFLALSNTGVLLSTGILIGVGSNLAFSVAPVFLSRYFGPHVLGELQGYVMGTSALALAAGPGIYGLAYDRMHSYIYVLSAMSVLMLIGSIMLTMLPQFADSKSNVSELELAAR
jgi:MFS family permease